MEEYETPKPRAPKGKSPKADKAMEIFDAVLDEHTIAQHTDVEELTVVAPAADETDLEPVEKVEEPAVVVPAASSAPASEYAVVSGKSVDDVALSSIVYKNIRAKKSLSVHHLQRRLAEWGYTEASLDRDGWYGDHTVNAVHEFQAKQGLAVGNLDMNTLLAIFENDSNVRVLP